MLDLLAGSWSFVRRIDDRRDGGLTEVEGILRLVPDGEGLAWDEAGLMQRPDGAVLKVGRRYLWRAGEGGAIRVLFADGRPFHAFDPRSGAEAVHDCASDRYVVRYAFELPDRWQATWRVTGPRKDYVSTTWHVRLG